MRLLLCFIFVLFINQLFCQIDFYIETDETCYSFGQDIYLTFNLHNTTSDTVIVTFLSSFPFDYYIDDELFIIGSYAVVFDVAIPPYSTFSEYYIHTDNVSVGDHILIGEFNYNWVSDPVSITIESVGVENIQYSPAAAGFNLQNFPNPFNPTTTISFNLTTEHTERNPAFDGNTEIIIYNIKGQKVKTLIDEKLDAGYHSVIWDGKDDKGKPVCSGIYLYKLNVNNKTELIRKCLLLK